MTPSQYLLEFNLNLQHRVAQLEQDNQQLQVELAQLRQEHKRLQQSQTRYRQLFENAPISMLFINPEGYITEMNQAAEQLFGLSLEQLNKQACPIFANPQLVENGTLPYMLRALAGETVIEAPTYYDTSKDFEGGKLNYGKGHYFPIRDKAEVVREIVEIAPDFADLWASQQTLQQERDRAATERIKLLSTIAQVANLLLRSPDYTSVLPDVLQLLGEAAGADRCSLAQNITDSASGKSAVRKNAQWCRLGIQASGAHTPELESALLWEDFAELYERLIRGETVQFFGTDLCVSLRKLFEKQGNKAMLMVPIAVQGEFWGVFGFDYCREVQQFEEIDQSIFAIAVDSIAAAIERQQQDEALRESEKRYRTLFELSSEGIYRYEFDRPIPLTLPIEEQIELTYRYFCVVEANTAYARMYGFVKPEDVVGLRLTDIYVENSKQNLTFLHTYIESVHCVRNLEIEEIDAQGQKHYFLNNVSGIVKDGCAIGGWGTQTDITELKQAQEALLQAEQARAAELAKANTALKNNLDRLAAEPELDAFLGHVILGIKQQLNAQLAYLFLYEPTSHTLNLYLGSEADWVLPKHELRDIDPFLAPIPADITRAWEILVQEKQPLEFGIWENPHPEHWPDGIKWHRRRGHQNVMCLPLLLGEEGLGFLGLAFTQQSSFTPEEFELAQALAHQATLAIQLTRLADKAKQAAIAREQEQAAQARATELAKINTGLKQMVSALSTATDLDQFLGYMLRVIAEQFDAPVTEYWVHPDGECAYLKLSCYQGQVLTSNEQPGHPGRLGYQIPPEMIHQERLNGRQHHFIIEDLRTDPIHKAIAAQIGIDIGEWRYRMRGVSKLLNIPLGIAEETIGALLIFVPSERQFTTQQIELGYALAQQVSLAIRLTQLAEQAKQSAIVREQEKVAQLQVAELAKANDILKKTLDTLATEPELDCFLRHILSVIAQQMYAPACLLWLFDDSMQTATLHLSYANGQVNLPAQPRFNAGPSHLVRLRSPDWVFRTDQRQPYLVKVANPPFSRASCAYLTRSGVKAILIVPLWLGDQLIGSFGVRLPEVRELAPSELELVQALAHQATLALQLMQLTEQASHSAVLEERNRMAREIHDVLAQAFTGVVVQLEAAKMIVPQDAPVQPLFAQAQDLARAGLVEARRSVWSLRPQALENTNLRSALEQLVHLAHKTSVQIHLQIQGADYVIAPEVETHLLRIAQEALTNALTHAQASTIVIELTFGTQAVELCVRDDGQGFEPTAVRGNGFGLVSMQERAGCINGEFTLTSQPGCGTIVLIAAPLSPQSKVPTRRS